jgi:hypothetical protein
MAKAKAAAQPSPSDDKRASEACAKQLAPDERVFLRYVTMFDIETAVAVARTLAKCGLTLETEAPEDQNRKDFLALFAANRRPAIEAKA